MFVHHHLATIIVATAGSAVTVVLAIMRGL